MSTATAKTAGSEPHDHDHDHDHDDDDVEESQLEFYAREIKDLAGVFSRTLYYCVRGNREKGDIARQMYAIGNGSMFFMGITMAFIGAIVAYQMGLQTRKIIPDMSLLGATFLKLQVRDLIASVGAMPLATRVGAGIAAEIGSMVVTEQTDALRMSAADPVDFLVVPRFLASVVMGTVVLCVGGAISILSGMVVCMVMFDVNPNTFFNFSMLTSGDVILGLLKMITYGGTIAIVSSQRGLRTFGGSEGVGIATTEAVVGSLFGIIIWQFILSAVGYVLLPA
ncbi:MAG: ABC transporter permease [Sandaracinaceae bacterium]|jgi:phospholipid/cholesterol/gamma-HCH transport system permease protein|nr:ABC transporter permease [Sandaracinaceae bacterium]MBK8406355.1 ABC transporter permease [Sandaracinaceae bacterium]MBK8591330.1 ABC transporter permease [Sandaracinaceae bacterium]